MYIYAHTLVNVRHFMEKYIVSCGLYTTVPTVRHFALLYLMYLTAPYCTLLHTLLHLTPPSTVPVLFLTEHYCTFLHPTVPYCSLL